MNNASETMYLRLGLNPHSPDSNLAKTCVFPTKITHLVSGLNKAQVLSHCRRHSVRDKVVTGSTLTETAHPGQAP